MTGLGKRPGLRSVRQPIRFIACDADVACCADVACGFAVTRPQRAAGSEGRALAWFGAAQEVAA
jgi:hypothetical protein